MLHLKQKVVHDALGQRFVMVSLYSKQNEITIPAVHLVEASTRNNIKIGQI